jgi:hypothetical protein
MEFSVKHKVLKNEDGEVAIEIESGEFSGMIFQYGNISFDEHENLETAEEIKMNYSYDILRGYSDSLDLDKFEKMIGDLLLEILKFEIERKELANIMESPDDDN